MIRAGERLLSRLHTFLRKILLTRAQSALSLEGGTCHDERRM